MLNFSATPIGLVLAFFVAWPAAVRGDDDALRLDRYVDLPAAGIRLRPFRDSTHVPLPAPQVWIYEKTDADERLEAYAPEELWYRDQHAASFRNAFAQVTLARVRYILPAALPLIHNQHIRFEDYTRLRSLIRSNWDEASLKVWVERFAEKPENWNSRVDGVRTRYLVQQFSLPDTAGQGFGFLLWDKKQDPICILFQFAASVSSRDAARAARALVVSVMQTRGGVRNETSADRFQNPRHRVDTPRDEGALRSRQKVIDSIRNLPDWWYVETPNYIVKSNLSKRDHRLVKQIQADIEILRKAYERLIPPIRPAENLGVLTVCGSREDYLAQVPAGWHWTSGIWMASRQELLISPSPAADVAGAAQAILSTVYHEAFHQYLFYALDLTPPPIWFNEGHAVLFESAEIDHPRKRLRITEHPLQVQIIERLLKTNDLQVSRVLDLSADEFYEGPVAATNYARAWALVYFLRKAAHLYPDMPYDAICDRIVIGLALDQDWRQVNQLAFESVDLERLNADVSKFWSTRILRRKAAEYRLFDQPLE